MNSRERMLAAIQHQQPDHVPMYCWCFGVTVPPHLRWQQNGREVVHWYTMRLEHIHTLPDPWRVEDEFERVRRWFSLGLDDVLEVSLPPGADPDVRIRDWQEPPTASEPYRLLCREYETPAGKLRHIVRRTEEKFEPGWVVQPDHVPLIEDMNIPRTVKPLVAGPDDLPKLRFVLREANAEQLDAYRERMKVVRRFADEYGVLIQGWGPIGIDASVYLCGLEAAVVAAMSEPGFFQAFIDLVNDFDLRTAELMLEVGGVNVIVQRGWFGATDFWSPALFRKFVLPSLRTLTRLVHQAGALMGYTMTRGAPSLADELADAGIDLLYYVDPMQDSSDLAEVKRKFSGRIALVGGVDSPTILRDGSRERIREAVQNAVRKLGPSGFILAPVDALFPDTPWSSVEAMIEAWKEVREVE
jgi:uroporphyrinogen-III decarboxylase